MTVVLDATVDTRRLRGRGACSNASGRYERQARVLLEDGWEADAPPPLKTELLVDTSRSVIARNTSPDIPFDRSINPYRGCEHGCIYCFARPSHAWLGLSPGADFESRLFVKPKAAELLAKELAAPGYMADVMAIGTNTDPYQPVERTHQVMRRVLEVLASCRHPVSITTKSALVVRDIDILSEMAKSGLARVALSITTLDRALARAMEPRASTPERRLDAIAALHQAGIPTSVMFAPVIPALNDSEMEKVLTAARQAGASSAAFQILRLPLEIKALFREWLEANRPDAAAHVISLLRQMHGGRDYDAAWHRRHRGGGPYAEMLAHRFALASRRLGLREPKPLRRDLFRRPSDQLVLF